MKVKIKNDLEGAKKEYAVKYIKKETKSIQLISTYALTTAFFSQAIFYLAKKIDIEIKNKFKKHL
jgi:hypothetical protein